MERLGAFDHGYTVLGSAEHIKIKPSQLCDVCSHHEPWWYTWNDLCTCPKDPICTYQATFVQICGKPVTANPCDACYRIRTWESEIPQSECTPNYFIEQDSIMDITLVATMDPIDMDHSYNDMLKKHYTGAIKGSTYSFKAPKGRNSYILDLRSRGSYF